MASILSVLFAETEEHARITCLVVCGVLLVMAVFAMMADISAANEKEKKIESLGDEKRAALTLKNRELEHIKKVKAAALASARAVLAAEKAKKLEAEVEAEPATTVAADT